jgi:hypothetical protein
MLLVLIAAGCLWAFVVVLRNLVRGERGTVWVVFAVVTIAAGVLLAALMPGLYDPHHANLPARLVSLSLLFGVPSVPLAVVTAILDARAAKKQRRESRRDRAGDSLRAWREKKNTKRDGDPPPAQNGDT